MKGVQNMRKSLLSVLLIVAVLPLGVSATHAQSDQRCFETGYCISGPIHKYWERNGGLAIVGYPIGEQQTEIVEGSWGGPVQWFERDRLEDHSNEGLGVLAGRLGALYLERVSDRPWETLAKASGAPTDCRYFPETQHTLCEPFLSYWQNNGGLERFGYPLSEVFREAIGEQTYTVQYFERRRMELHPENQPPYNILLGLLGRDIGTFSGVFCQGWSWFFSPAPSVCPNNSPFFYDGAAQRFERGFMLWTREPDQFRIFLDNGSILSVSAPYTFKTVTPVDETPPPGRYTPVSGFGSVWRGEIVVPDHRAPLRDLLGWAVEPEHPYTTELQCHRRRFMEMRCYQRDPSGEVIWYGLGPPGKAWGRVEP
jgi:hypothetical protein